MVRCGDDVESWEDERGGFWEEVTERRACALLEFVEHAGVVGSHCSIDSLIEIEIDRFVDRLRFRLPGHNKTKEASGLEEFFVDLDKEFVNSVEGISIFRLVAKLFCN